MTCSYLFIKACFFVVAVAAAIDDDDTCAASPGGCTGKNEADANTLIQSRVRISGGLAPDLKAEDPPDSDSGDAGVDIDHMGLPETDGSEPAEHVPGEEIGPLELDEATTAEPTTVAPSTTQVVPDLCAEHCQGCNPEADANMLACTLCAACHEAANPCTSVCHEGCDSECTECADCVAAHYPCVAVCGQGCNSEEDANKEECAACATCHANMTTHPTTEVVPVPDHCAYECHSCNTSADADSQGCRLCAACYEAGLCTGVCHEGCNSTADFSKETCHACAACVAEHFPCAAVCGEGCNSEEDASKEECAACATCHANMTTHPTTEGTPCRGLPDGCETQGATFCNYDHGASGFCEQCPVGGCNAMMMLPDAGAADCHKWC